MGVQSIQADASFKLEVMYYSGIDGEFDTPAASCLSKCQFWWNVCGSDVMGEKICPVKYNVFLPEQIK